MKTLFFAFALFSLSKLATAGNQAFSCAWHDNTMLASDGSIIGHNFEPVFIRKTYALFAYADAKSVSLQNAFNITEPSYNGFVGCDPTLEKAGSTCYTYESNGFAPPYQRFYIQVSNGLLGAEKTGTLTILNYTNEPAESLVEDNYTCEK